MALIQSRRASAATLALFLVALPASAQTATFENIVLPGPNSFENGANLSPPGGFVSGGSTFTNSFDTTYGSWSGWAVSNVVDMTTPGYLNQYAAFSGTGAAGSANYGVAYTPGGATVLLPGNTAPVSLQITNTTYAAMSMIEGDSFAKKFGGLDGNDPDFFRLTITGRTADSLPTGTIDFYLADYRFADNSQDYVVSAWTEIDLTSLGAGTTQLSFSLASSDMGEWGINTPTYFAADNLVTAPVPEPAGLLVAAAAALWVRRRAATARSRPHDTPARA